MNTKLIAGMLLFVPFLCFSSPLPEVFRDEVTLTGGVKNLSVIEDGCDEHDGYFRAQRLQYSDDGSVIKVIQFRRGDGNVFAIPTNFSNLSKPQYEDLSRVIKEGVNYWIKFSTCGSGGYMSLIDISTSVGM